MTLFTQILFIVFPYIGFLCLLWLFFTFYKWAKKRKAAAIGLGMMMHVLVPVPNAEKAIVEVIEKKKIQERKSAQIKSDK